MIRTMPNTPAQIGRGISGAVAGPGATARDREVADACGRCVAVGTGDGRLYLLTMQAGASTADADAFALTLISDGTPRKALEQPWAALALLPPASGGGRGA